MLQVKEKQMNEEYEDKQRELAKKGKEKDDGAMVDEGHAVSDEGDDDIIF